MATTEWSVEAGAQVVAQHAGVRGPLLPVLHALQDEFGYVDPAAVPLVARALNVSRAEVHGVMTFYRDFRTTPPGARTVRVCRGEACQSRGGNELAAHARSALGVGFGETTADGGTTLEQVFCLGMCALSPAVMVDGRVVARVDADVFDEVVGV
ncbi:MAG TPA: formate dehydrogenase subunit gamma [Candidatus Angelobacter sp.]|nr:formate dehydrogenase subunit gamma [Candidatus Angelobacter sp.]